jgi:hypothetical protein
VKEADPVHIVRMLRDVVDLFEFGKWNKYRKQGIPEIYYRNYSEAYYVELFRRIIDFCETQKVNYCIAAHSRSFIEEHTFPFRPYPLVKAR